MKLNEFKELPKPPETIEATSVMMRLIDGIVFRFYNATDNLREIDHSFRPAEDCMSVNELLHHIETLAYWVRNSFTEKKIDLNFDQRTFNDMRLSILNTFNEIKNHLDAMESSKLKDITIRDYPFWNMINGPLADTLTHIGQINTYRRLNGNPAGKRSPFTGK